MLQEWSKFVLNNAGSRSGVEQDQRVMPTRRGDEVIGGNATRKSQVLALVRT